MGSYRWDWPKADDDVIRQLYAKTSVEKIALLLGRRPQAVIARANRLNVFKPQRPYSQKRIEAYAEQGDKQRDIRAAHLNGWPCVCTTIEQALKGRLYDSVVEKGPIIFKIFKPQPKEGFSGSTLNSSYSFSR